MEDISSVSPAELAERRRSLRRQRQWRVFQASWQVLILSSLTIGLIRVVTLPDWMIHDSSQIVIDGNKTLSADTVRSLLPIRYPQFLLTLKPQDITRSLQAKAPIANVTVTRHLFPPGLVVHIQERYPVAVVYSAPTSPTLPKKQQTQTPIALLDDQGAVIAYQSYAALNQTQELPALKVIGYQERYRSQWATLYALVSHSPVKVSEIDWRDPGNLILLTDMGTVHFGSYSSRFADQLRVLDRMRQISKSVDSDKIAYLDLRNPESPLLEMVDARQETPTGDDVNSVDMPPDAQPDAAARSPEPAPQHPASQTH